MSHGAKGPMHHMNTDHARELLDAARAFGAHPDATSARAEGVDPDGVDIVVQTPGGDISARLNFAEHVLDYPDGLRAAFDELTGRARARLGPSEPPGKAEA